MVRRGWKSFDVPTGWVQIVRGPRPKSEKWPRAGQQFRQPAQQSQPQPAAVRPPQSQGKTSGMRPFQDPSAKVAEAKERVLKLETALAAMEGMEGPEVDLVRAAHKRAQEAVKGVPVDVQIKECESFLARARTHLEELDTKRATVSQNIAMSEKRLAELKALAQVAPAPQDDAAEVQQLRGLVSQLQTQIDSLRSGPTPDSRSDGPMPKRTCRREEFIPQCDEEMEEWMAGRHKDLQVAMESGKLPEVARVSQLMTNAAREWHQLIQEQTAAPSTLANMVR